MAMYGKKRVVGAVGVATILTCFTACGSTKHASSASSSPATATASGGGLPSKIVIGVPLDLSGLAAVTGIADAEKAGIDLAVSQANSSHVLGNVTLSTDVEDLQFNATTTVSQVTRLVNAHVAAVVGFSATTDVLAGAPLLQKAGIPMISVSSGAPGFQNDGNYIFRAALDSGAQATAGVKQIMADLANLHPSRVAYLYVSDNDASVSGYKAMEPVINASGAKVVATQTITSSQTDYRAELTAIEHAKPDLVAVSATAGQDAGVYTQGKQVGLFPGPQIIDAGSSIGGDPEAALVDADCAMFPSTWLPSSPLPASKAFITAFEAANKKELPTVWSALGYQAMMAMVSAIKQAGSTNHAAIQSALATLSVPGILGGGDGTFAFTSGRVPTYPQSIGQIVNGQIVAYKAGSTCTA